jgi:hypothetical protein
MDEAGDAVGEARIQAEAVPAASVPLTFLSAGFGVTNDRGEYRMSVPPGKYRIKAEMHGFPDAEPGEIRTDGSAPAVHPATWYPRAANAEAAAVVEVRPGLETKGVDIRMGNAVRLTIDGIVTGLTGGVRASVSVNAFVHHGNSVEEAAVGPDGRFSLGRLEQGTYFLYAWTNEQNHLQSAPVRLELTDAAVSNVMLALKPPAAISGTLEMEAGAGEAAAHSVRLEPADDLQAAAGDRHSGVVTRDGTFTIRGVTPNRYRLLVRPLAEDAYVKTVRLDGVVAPFAILDLRDGLSGSELKIAVGADGARISGSVTNAPGRPATALLVPESAETRVEAWRYSPIAPNGSYGFRGLPPGKYRLLVVLNGEKPVEAVANAERIELKTGDQLKKDLKVDDARK